MRYELKYKKIKNETTAKYNAELLVFFAVAEALLQNDLQNTSEHYIINNYSAAKYYFLSILIGARYICSYNFACRKMTEVHCCEKMIIFENRRGKQIAHTRQK